MRQPLPSNMSTIGLALDRAATLITRSLAHWRDGDVRECLRDAKDAQAALAGVGEGEG
jgi:hypothetical protein